MASSNRKKCSAIMFQYIGITLFHTLKQNKRRRRSVPSPHSSLEYGSNNIDKLWIVRKIINRRLIFYLNILKILRFHAFIGDFGNTEIFSIFGCPKNFRLLEYGRVMHGLKHAMWRFRLCTHFCRIRDGGGAGKFKYFTKRFILTESPDHVLLNDINMFIL